MKSKLLLAAAAVVAFALSPVPQAQAQSLAGSQVTAGAYCCSAPVTSDLVTNTVTSIVGPDVEFPEGSFVTVMGFQAIPATIDVGNTTIEFTYSGGGTATPGGFNGFVFSFDGAPTITGAAIDPTSTYTPVVTFDENTVFVNEAGVTLEPGSHLLLNISAVPEPEAYALLLGGLGLLGAMARRRKA